MRKMKFAKFAHYNVKLAKIIIFAQSVTKISTINYSQALWDLVFVKKVTNLENNNVQNKREKEKNEIIVTITAQIV